MTHKMTVRLSDATWYGLEQVLATNNMTASAFFEAAAIFATSIATANELKPYMLWDTPAEQTLLDGFQKFFEIARQIDHQRRSRRPD